MDSRLWAFCVEWFKLAIRGEKTAGIVGRVVGLILVVVVAVSLHQPVQIFIGSAFAPYLDLTASLGTIIAGACLVGYALVIVGVAWVRSDVVRLEIQCGSDLPYVDRWTDYNQQQTLYRVKIRNRSKRYQANAVVVKAYDCNPLPESIDALPWPLKLKMDTDGRTHSFPLRPSEDKDVDVLYDAIPIHVGGRHERVFMLQLAYPVEDGTIPVQGYVLTIQVVCANAKGFTTNLVIDPNADIVVSRVYQSQS